MGNLDISDKTRVPLFAVIGVVGSLMGLVASTVIWVSRVEARGVDTEARVDRISTYAQKTNDSVVEGNMRLARVEAKQDLILEMLSELKRRR